MSAFQFAPAFGDIADEFCYWQSGFEDHHLDEIIEIGKLKSPQKASIGGYKEDENYKHVRKSSTSWICQNDCPWLYERMAHICNTLNARFYNFDMFGFWEDFQYTEYEGAEQGHYDWHIDSGHSDSRPPRKLSFILQLSDPEEYEGGDIQLRMGTEPLTLPKEKGLVVMFPSYQLHRVTPVTSGHRKTLVGWLTGPRFR